MSAPIGVFDSGMGGLTVLRALQQALPQESFVYLGDTARLPYGTKSAQTVTRYALRAARRLVEEPVRALVIACNTASAVAVPALRSAFPEVPVFGVVEPGAAAAANAHGRSAGVLVLATESTIEGGAYARAILRRNAAARVWSRACPLLVPLAEEGRVADAAAHLVLRGYLHGLLDGERVQTVLLGCTHYPVFQPLLAELLADVPNPPRVVDSAATTAAVVADALARNADAAASANAFAPTNGTVRYLATDGAERFRRIGRQFLGAPVDEVTLVDL